MRSRKLATTFLRDPRESEVDLFHSMDIALAQIFGQIISMRVKALGNTNLVASSHIIKEKTSLPVDVRRSKTPF